MKFKTKKTSFTIKHQKSSFYFSIIESRINLNRITKEKSKQQKVK